MISWRTMRIVILALLIMAGILGAAVVRHYDLPLLLSQLRRATQAPSPTPPADTATTADTPRPDSLTPNFPVLTLTHPAMNPFIEMPIDAEPAQSPEDPTPQDETEGRMREGD